MLTFGTKEAREPLVRPDVIFEDVFELVVSQAPGSFDPFRLVNCQLHEGNAHGHRSG